MTLSLSAQVVDAFDAMPPAQQDHTFVAFGQSLRAFEAQLRRMAGQDDGITDALFGMSRPITSASFWCPPMRDGRLDLRHLGL